MRFEIWSLRFSILFATRPRTRAPIWHPNVCKIARHRSERLQISILRKDGESGGILKGNNNQNDMNCLQIIIEIVIQRDNLHFLRNYYVIFGRI